MLDRQHAQYAQDGQLKEIVDKTNSDQRICLDYDGLDRLTEAFTGTNDCSAVNTSRGQGPFDIDYTYDGAGRIGSVVQSHPGSATRDYTYGTSQPHAVVTAGDNDYSYDAAGNMVVRDVDEIRQELAYDPFGRLKQVQGADGTVSQFLYDAAGGRVAKWDGQSYTVYIGDSYQRTSHPATDGSLEDAATFSTVASSRFPGTSLWHHDGATAAAHAGTKAVSVSNHAKGRIQSDPVAATGGETLEVSTWAKGHIAAESHGGWLLRGTSLDSNGQVLGEANAVVVGGEWSSTGGRHDGQFVTEPGTAAVRVELWVFSASGHVVFDDVELSRSGGPNLLANPGFGSGSGWATIADSDAGRATGFYRGGVASGASGAGWMITNLAYGKIRSQPFSVDLRGTQDFDISWWARGELDADQTLRHGIVRVVFFDAAGQPLPGGDKLIDIDHLKPSELTGSWQQFGGTFTAPADAVTASVDLFAHATAGWIAYDDISVTAAGSSTELVADGGFETGGTWSEFVDGRGPGTSLWRAGFSTAAPHSGSKAYALSNHAYGEVVLDRVAATPGDVLDLATRYRGEVDTAESEPRVQLQARFFDSDGAKISQSTISADNQPGTTWQPVAGTVSVPAGAVEVQVRARALFVAGWYAFDDLHVASRADATVTVHYPGVGHAVDGAMRWSFTDHLGSTHATYDHDTGQIRRQLYGPFGTIRHTDGLDTDIGYTGQRADTSTGLMYYHARYYDPSLARFVQADTLIPDPARSADYDRYAYVRNNPYNHTDPTGHVTCSVSACVPSPGVITYTNTNDAPASAVHADGHFTVYDATGLEPVSDPFLPADVYDNGTIVVDEGSDRMYAHDSAWTGSSTPLGAQNPKSMKLASDVRREARARSEAARHEIGARVYGLGPAPGVGGGCVSGFVAFVVGVSYSSCSVTDSTGRQAHVAASGFGAGFGAGVSIERAAWNGRGVCSLTGHATSLVVALAPSRPRDPTTVVW